MSLDMKRMELPYADIAVCHAGSGAKEKLPCKIMDLSAPVCYTESGLNKAQIVYKVK